MMKKNGMSSVASVDIGAATDEKKSVWWYNCNRNNICGKEAYYKKNVIRSIFYDGLIIDEKIKNIYILMNV